MALDTRAPSPIYRLTELLNPDGSGLPTFLLEPGTREISQDGLYSLVHQRDELIRAMFAEPIKALVHENKRLAAELAAVPTDPDRLAEVFILGSNISDPGDTAFATLTAAQAAGISHLEAYYAATPESTPPVTWVSEHPGYWELRHAETAVWASVWIQREDVHGAPALDVSPTDPDGA
jgi:hypothetical protein